MEPKVKPLKRHPELVNLSREHHFELLFSWKIKQGLARKVDNHLMQDYVRYFWDHHLESHLEKEEKIMVQVLSEADPMRFRVLEDHDLIRSLVNYLGGQRENISYLLDTLQNLVKEHVRFEERIFFPYLEQVATPGQLILIGLELDKHQEEHKDEFTPAFWFSSQGSDVKKEDEQSQPTDHD